MTQSSDLKPAIVKALRKVHDPEIPVNIYDLGLIYALDISDDNAVDVEMTLTAPNCPVADQIPAQVEQAVRGVEGVTNVSVRLVWQPAWTPDKMTEIARIDLQSRGIDPDRAKDQLAGKLTGLTLGRRPTDRR